MASAAYGMCEGSAIPHSRMCCSSASNAAQAASILGAGVLVAAGADGQAAGPGRHGQRGAGAQPGPALQGVVEQRFSSQFGIAVAGCGSYGVEELAGPLYRPRVECCLAEQQLCG